MPNNPAAPPAPPTWPGAPEPPAPPLPHKIPPAPPACPVPGAPAAPSPINGRPSNAWVGALRALSTLCSSVANGAALVASALTYEPTAALNVCANRS
ncbi:Uncharacterised protein [Mycobacterium tuberculosis]|nr:Uncharacterised protein [Mycobacterium tuberculosis]CKX01170.1 Uncharacterised protein [Mycobacterium tuberculosis]CLA03919.1 Uncharacterised protein [Mycobacterium tuberculosis]CNM48252.1 Uncharacterised protein [Mycobacterium tuberculosis]CNM89540.1 Uncharacterised protein [Mycobacterium tuberculosis]